MNAFSDISLLANERAVLADGPTARVSLNHGLLIDERRGFLYASKCAFDLPSW